MKKGLFIFIILFIGSLRVIALDVPSFVSQVPKCVEDKENTVLIPVNVLTYKSGDLVSLIDNYSLGLIDRYDNYDIKIDNIEGNKIKNVLLSSLKSANRSYINYNIEDNIHLELGDTLVSFNILINFSEYVPEKIDVLGNEVIISNKETCSVINKENEEVVRTEVFFKKDKSSNFIYLLIIITLLMFALLEFIVILRKRNK